MGKTSDEDINETDDDFAEDDDLEVDGLDDDDDDDDLDDEDKEKIPPVPTKAAPDDDRNRDARRKIELLRERKRLEEELDGLDDLDDF